MSVLELIRKTFLRSLIPLLVFSLLILPGGLAIASDDERDDYDELKSGKKKQNPKEGEE